MRRRGYAALKVIINKREGDGKMKKTIKPQELVEILRGYTGVVFASVTYLVDESKSRTVNGSKVLQKMVSTRITLNSIYERKVNRILEKKQGEMPTFTAEEMKGKYQVFPDCKCILKSEKTGELLLYGAIEHNARPHVTYFHNGKIITKEEAIKKDLFMPSAFAPKKTMGRGAVEEENDFALISPRLSSILSITLNGVRYRIDHS